MIDSYYLMLTIRRTMQLCVMAGFIAAAAPALLHADETKSSLDRMQPGRYTIEYKEGLVTVLANDANTEQLLTEFAQKSGIVFNKYTGKSPKTTLDLKDVPAEDFLNRILGSFVTTSKKKNGLTLISAVRIMDEGPENPNVPPPPPRAEENPEVGGPLPPQAGDSERERFPESPWRRSKSSSRRRSFRDPKNPPDASQPPGEEGEPISPPPDIPVPPEEMQFPDTNPAP